MTINLMMLEAVMSHNRAKYIEANAQLQTLLRHPSPSEVEDYTEKVLQYADVIAACERTHQVLQEVAAVAPEVEPHPETPAPTEAVEAPTPMPSDAPSHEQQEETFTEEELLKRSPTMRESLQRKFQDGE